MLHRSSLFSRVHYIQLYMLTIHVLKHGLEHHVVKTETVVHSAANYASRWKVFSFPPSKPKGLVKAVEILFNYHPCLKRVRHIFHNTHSTKSFPMGLEFPTK